MIAGHRLLRVAVLLVLPLLLPACAPRLQPLGPAVMTPTYADTNLVMDALTAPLSGVVSRDPRSRLHRALVEIMDSELAAGGSLLTSSESRLVKKSEEAFYA